MNINITCDTLTKVININKKGFSEVSIHNSVIKLSSLTHVKCTVESRVTYKKNNDYYVIINGFSSAWNHRFKGFTMKNFIKFIQSERYLRLIQVLNKINDNNKL